MKTFILIIIFLGSSGIIFSQSTLPKKSEERYNDTTSFKTETVVINADRIYSAATDQTFRLQNLNLLPRSSSQDILRIVPGLITAQHAGGGKAEQIFLRGFDCDHGTDVNIKVDGAPVNMVSHGHGQGYADLHFIIPETIERVEVVKGPYFASYGDLTTAGAVTFRTADTLANNIIKAEAGSFSTFRGLGLFTTSIGATKTYGGAELFSSRSFFDAPQNFSRVNYIGKTYTPISDNSILTASIMGFSSRWDASGQIPQRAVESGLITRFGTIDPNEGGNTNRTTLQLALETKGESPMKLSASFTDYQFQLFSNFTFFAIDSVRGDMIEQTDNRSVIYIRGEKDFFSLFGSVGMKTKFGADMRNDNIRAALYHNHARTRLETTRDNKINQTNVGVFAENSFLFSDLSIQLGLRGDYIGFNVQNIAQQGGGAHGTSNKFVVSPKANVSLAVSENASLFFNSGFGFHSNDARVAVSKTNGNTVPRAFGSEIGARWTGERISVSTDAWLLDLENEFIWIGDEGTTEEAGRSRRIGIDVELRYNTTDWLTVGTELTMSKGRLLDLPEGENFIALAPNITMTAFTTFKFDEFSTALRLRHIGSRPANEDNSLTATGYSILDLTAVVPVSDNFDLTFQFENMLNSQWREAQFDTSSRLPNEPVAVSEVNYTPGTPASIRMGVSAKF